MNLLHNLCQGFYSLLNFGRRQLATINVYLKSTSNSAYRVDFPFKFDTLSTSISTNYFLPQTSPCARNFLFSQLQTFAS